MAAKKIIPTAECRFCGQMIQLEGDCGLTQPQAEEKATMACRCMEAVEYQKEKLRKEKAMKNVSVLFGGKRNRRKEPGRALWIFCGQQWRRYIQEALQKSHCI